MCARAPVISSPCSVLRPHLRRPSPELSRLYPSFLRPPLLPGAPDPTLQGIQASHTHPAQLSLRHRHLLWIPTLSFQPDPQFTLDASLCSFQSNSLSRSALYTPRCWGETERAWILQLKTLETPCNWRLETGWTFKCIWNPTSYFICEQEKAQRGSKDCSRSHS